MFKQDLIQGADDERSRLFMEKMDADNEKKKAQKEFEDLAELEDKLALQYRRDVEEIQVNIDHTAS